MLDDLDADLVTVWPEEARWWGENGLLLPLERFGGAEESERNQEFFPTVLDQFRRDGALYALPVDAMPLMLFYDEDFLAQQGVPPPDASWHWDDLARHAAELTTATQDGTVKRWGLIANANGVAWALWQNEASIIDLDSRHCRLSEPAAVEALQFVHDLLHKHRVSPLAEMRDLWDYLGRTPPAMLYDFPPLIHTNRKDFRMAALPQGKTAATPVRTSLGIGVAARTQNVERAFMALRGFNRVMQEHVAIPAGRDAVARLADLRPDISPEEVSAVQYSLEHGRGYPQHSLPLTVMHELNQSLSRGDDVASIVNQACNTVHEY
jgi:ABC-type glycerol-3-phosphate transport system substrate-binding protein